MSNPLVTIVGRSYDQAPYIRESIESIFNQTYQSIQVILVDDGSTDTSRQVIMDVCKHLPVDHYFLGEENKGICASFNQCIPFIKGKYIIDLALDDLLLPGRIEKQIEFFEQYPDAGMVYHEAEYIDSNGSAREWHFRDNPKRSFKNGIPSGDIFIPLLKKYFLPSPTTMFRTDVLKHLNGFDERYSYEDWDFLLRLARDYPIYYQPVMLTRIRLHQDSTSTRIGQKHDPQLWSTAQICENARATLIRNKSERFALRERVVYYIRKCLRNFRWKELRYFLIIYSRLL